MRSGPTGLLRSQHRFPSKGRALMAILRQLLSLLAACKQGYGLDYWVTDCRRSACYRKPLFELGCQASSSGAS